MKTKYLVICILVVIAAALSVVYLRRNGGQVVPPPVVVNPKHGDAPVNFTDTQAPKDLSGAHNAFGIDIFKNIAKADPGSNVFISPTSIALALSMVYDGSAGDTQAAMAKTLHLEDLGMDTLNKQSAGLMQAMQNPDPKIKLAIANSVWAKQGVTFRQSFLDTVAKFFIAKVSTLDFNNPQSVQTINTWASDNTNGKIPSIISSISPDMVMYLINAVYFKGSWTHAFDAKLTQDGNFNLADGSVARRPFMQMQREDFQYFETNDFQSISLPYGDNQRLSMDVFLPKGKVADLINGLDQKTWDSWMTKYQATEGTVLLPKFKSEYQRELNTDLADLGMGAAFGNRADFSGIGDSLAISQVIHKTYVDVNEEGTEAAAVTGVGMVATAIRQVNQAFYMDVNKPFLFAIRDNQTGELLFIGVIENPQV